MTPRSTSIAAGGIVAVLGVALLVITDAADPFDRSIIDVLRGAGTSTALAFLGPVTELGSTGAIILVALLTFALAAAIGPWRHGAIGAAVIGAAALGVELVKAVVARTRPDLLEPLIVEHGFSFPSGHATLSMTGYGILSVLVLRSRLPHAWRIAAAVGLAVVVFLVGLSRIWLGVHFPTDVIAGWITGFVVVILFRSATRRVSREPAEGAVDEDPAAPRSDPPAPG